MVSVGEILGAEDCLLDNRPRMDTLKCSSLKGELLEIDYEEFLRQIKKVEGTWEIFEQQVLNKETRRTKLLDYVKRSNVISDNEKGKSRNKTPSKFSAKTDLYETPRKSQEKIFRELGIFGDYECRSSLVAFPRQLTPIFSRIQKARTINPDSYLKVLKKRAERIREYRPQNANEVQVQSPLKVSRTERAKLAFNSKMSPIFQTPQIKRMKHQRSSILRTTKK